MPWLAVLGAVVVCGGGALAAATADRRLAILGLTVAMVGAPLIGTRAPDLLSLAFREVAALTGTYLLWISSGRGRPSEHGEDGPLFPAIFVVVAFVGTLILAPTLGPDRGPIVGLAAAAAAAMAALALSVRATDLLGGGLGAIMLLLAASLATTGLAGISGPLEHAVMGAALVAVTAAAAFVGSGQPPAQNDPFPTFVEPPAG